MPLICSLRITMVPCYLLLVVLLLLSRLLRLSKTQVHCKTRIMMVKAVRGALATRSTPGLVRVP